MADHDKPEVMVLIPYSTLQQLLEAPEAIIKLKQDNRVLYHMVGALRGQLLEVMDKVRELDRAGRDD